MGYKLQRRKNKKQKWKDTIYKKPFAPRGKGRKGTKHITKLGAKWDKKITELINKGEEIRIVKTRIRSKK